MRFITLTPNKYVPTVHLNAENIEFLSRSLDPENNPVTIVEMASGRKCAVKESIEEILEKIGGQNEIHNL